MTKRRNLRTAALVAVSMLWGCAGSAREASPPPPPPPPPLHAAKPKAARAMPSAPMREHSQDFALDAADMPQPLVASMAAEDLAAPPPPPPPPAEAPGQTVQNPSGKAVSARLVAYQGWIQLAGLEPDALLDSAERRVVALEGYVESRRGRHLVLRVPVHRFEQLFQEVRTLGKVVSSRKSAEDVTEAVESTDLELQLRRTQLAKLKSILQRETKINERASLLQEIRRVSEEIARLDARAALLRKRVQLSTLEVDAISLAVPTARRAQPPPSMAWIGSLFEESSPGWISSTSRAFPLRGSTEFVALLGDDDDDRPAWQAAAADGSIVSSFRLENLPRGDGRFWRSAILHYRGEGFSTPDTSTVEGWSVARLAPILPEGPVWWVAVRTSKDGLHVVQARMSGPADRRLAGAFRRMLQESKP